MKLKINVNLSAWIGLFALFIALFFGFSLFFSDSIILYLGLPFSAALLLFFYSTLHPEETAISIKVTRSQLPMFLLGIVTLLSALIVIIVPSNTGSVLDFGAISSLNWLRYVSAVLLTTVLPGYFLLRVLDNNRTIRGWIVVVLSYLLSIFLTFLSGFLILLSGNSITSVGLPVVVGESLVLMGLFYVMCRKRAIPSLNFDRKNILLLFSIVGLALVGSIIVLWNNLPLTNGDMWDHHGYALLYTERFPVSNGFLPSYPYLFSIYEAVLFSISGISSLISEQMLYLFSFIPILALYALVKEWFGTSYKGISGIAVFFSTLFGFGSLYVVYLKFTDPLVSSSLKTLLQQASYKTYDIYLRANYLPDIVAPIWNVGIPVFLVLLYFLHKDSGKLPKFAIVTMLVITGYLGHEAELIVFVALYFFYVLLFSKKPEWLVTLSVLLGIVIVVVLNVAIPGRVFTLGLQLDIMIFFSILALLVSILKTIPSIGRLFGAIKNSCLPSRIYGFSKKHIRWVLLYLYLISIAVWFMVFDNYLANGDYVPLYVFALRLGAVGAFLVVGIAFCFSDIVDNRKLRFFVFISIIGVTLEQIANYYSIGYPASRFAMYTFFGGCLIASYFITTYRDSLFNRGMKRKLVAVSVLVLVILPGALGTTLYYTSASYYNNQEVLITDQEMGALAYIKDNLASNSSVIVFSANSRDKLMNLAGVNSLQIMYDYLHYFLRHDNPSIPLYVMGNSQTRYIYVNQQYDAASVKDFSPFLASALKTLPVAYLNSEVTVYEIPLLSPPTYSSQSVVIYPTQESAALSFDGSKSYVLVNSSKSLNPSDAISVECWATVNGVTQMLLSKDNTGTSKAQWYLAVANERLVWTVNVDNKLVDISSLAIIKPGSSYHIVATYENGVGSKIFVNGKIVAEKNQAGLIKTDNQALVIGGSQNGVAYHLKGAMEDVRMYTRALTATEVTAHFNGVYTDEAGLVLNLPLDNIKGNIQADLSGNSNNGVAFGTQWLVSQNDLNADNLDIVRCMMPSVLKWDYSVIPKPAEGTTEYYTSSLQDASLAVFLQDPLSNEPGVLQWVSKGGTIVVLDNNDNIGYFSELLNVTKDSTTITVNSIQAGGSTIQVPPTTIYKVSVGGGVQSPVYYRSAGGDSTPLVLEKTWDNGKIFFVRLSPVLSNIETLTQQQVDDLANIVNNVFDSINTPVSAFNSYPQLPDYDCIAEGFHTSGSVIFNSTYVTLSQPIQGAELELHLSNTNLKLDNATIAALRLSGPVNILATNTAGIINVSLVSNMLTMTNDANSNIEITPRNFDESAVNAYLLIANSTGKFEVSGTLNKISLVANSSNLQIQNPSVKMEGETLFSAPYIHSSTYTLLAGAIENLKMQGTISFKVQFSDGTSAFISNINYAGQACQSQDTSKQLAIPWVAVLLSPLHLSVILILLLVHFVSRNLTMHKELERLKIEKDKPN